MGLIAVAAIVGLAWGASKLTEKKPDLMWLGISVSYGEPTIGQSYKLILLDPTSPKGSYSAKDDDGTNITAFYRPVATAIVRFDKIVERNSVKMGLGTIVSIKSYELTPETLKRKPAVGDKVLFD